MKKFENLLLASDVDGTLLLNNKINPKNLDRIRYFTENGGRFLLATGRNCRELPVIMPELLELVNAPCVISNGGAVYDISSGEYENCVYLNNDHLAGLLEDVEKRFPLMGFRASDSKGFVIRNYDESIKYFLSRSGLLQLAEQTTIEGMKAYRLFKGVFVQEPKMIEEVKEYVTKRYSSVFSFTKSATTILEVQPVGIEKSYQLRYLKEKMANQGSDPVLCCIGDFDNDVGMLKAADESACPANSTMNAMNAACYHVCHCDDGAVAEFIDILDKKYPLQ